MIDYPRLIHAIWDSNKPLPKIFGPNPLKIIHERIAAVTTKIVVITSEYRSPKDFAKYPNIEPSNGKKISA